MKRYFDLLIGNLSFLGILFASIFIVFTLIQTYSFIKEHLKYRRYIKRIKEWTSLNDQLLIWYKEIIDISTRQEFHKDCLEIISKVAPNSIENININEERQRVVKKWGKYIPSIIKQEREIKLSKILHNNL